MVNKEFRYLQISEAQFEAMQQAIARKVEFQFTADELELMLGNLGGFYPDEKNNYEINALKDKVFRLYLESRKNER